METTPVPAVIERPKPKVIANRNLPLPRLEIRWKIISPEERHAHYDLVMPADKYDIRNPNEYKKNSCFRVSINITKSSGSPLPSATWPDWPFNGDGTITAPFRDSSHIAWDAKALNIPAFIVHGRKAQVVEPAAPGK